MKVLSKIGEAVAEHMLELLVLGLAVLFCWLITSGPYTVRLAENEWECTRAGTRGLDTQCLEYRRIEK